MYRLAIYGKGGIGKSTTTCNIAAALASRGHTVMQIGCDPKADSTKLHMGGETVRTVLDCMRAGGQLTLEDVVHRAPDGVLCVEAGGPVPGMGCAGRGIVAAFDTLKKLRAFETYEPDVVLYDVLGDVVCGGFAMPMRGEYADAVMIVTSGEMMSLYAASNIMRAIENFQKRGYAHLAGLIANMRNVPGEAAKIAQFCEEEGARVVATVPRSPLIQQAEDAGSTVVSVLPDSELAEVYRGIAAAIEHDAEALAASGAAGTSRAVGTSTMGAL